MTTFVLIPGAGGDPWYWHRLTPLLEAAGHRVVAVALPAGHEGAGWSEYADAVVDATPGGPVQLVAQSMGGFTAPIAADRLGRQVEGITLINAMIPAPRESAGTWWEATGQPAALAAAARADGRPEEFRFPDDFFHDVPPDVFAEAMAAGDPAQEERPFVEAWPLSRWPDIPTRAIAGADDRLFPVDFQRRVAQERLGLEVDVVPGGHLVALSRPDSLAAALIG